MNNINFGSSTRMYFYTSDGQRIVSDDNISKCERYVVSHLNGSKNIKNRNMDLVNTFTYDKKQGVGDKDYYNYMIVRSGYGYDNKRKNGKVNIITGYRDVVDTDSYAKQIGIRKHEAMNRTGEYKSFEVSQAINLYNKQLEYLDKSHGIYKDGERQAFKVIFEPQYKKNGELKGFAYKDSGYINESELNLNV